MTETKNSLTHRPKGVGREKMLINGEWVEAENGQWVSVKNPAHRGVEAGQVPIGKKMSP